MSPNQMKNHKTYETTSRDRQRAVNARIEKKQQDRKATSRHPALRTPTVREWAGNENKGHKIYF
jgi:hypothetical protein